MLWVISVYFNIRNTLPKSGTFLLGHPVYNLRNEQFIHSFHWHVQNAMFPCHSQKLLPFLSVIYFSCHPSPPTILPSSLTSSFHLFLGLPLNLVVSKFIYTIILFWEFYFLPFSVHAQTNVIYLTLLSLL